MTARLNSRVMLLVCLGLGWSGEGWGVEDCEAITCSSSSPKPCYGDKDNDSLYSSYANYCSSTGTCPTGYIASSGTDLNDCEPVNYYYYDSDGDGQSGDDAILRKNEYEYGELSSADQARYDTISLDCNDSDATEYVGAVWYEDSDGDGYYAVGATKNSASCAKPIKYVSQYRCDDPAKFSTCVKVTDSGSYDCLEGVNVLSKGASINPGAESDLSFDGYDRNCDGTCFCYIDCDGDGFGDNNMTTEETMAGGSPIDGICYCDDTTQKPTTCSSSSISASFSSDPRDCDDGNFDIKPGVEELCEEAAQVDDDCNESVHTYVPEGGSTTAVTKERGSGALRFASIDSDGDGYGAYSGDVRGYCGTTFKPKLEDGLTDDPFYSGYVNNVGDCDDGEKDVGPHRVEACYGSDAIDDDCDGQINEPWTLSDMDFASSAIIHSEYNFGGSRDKIRAVIGCDYYYLDADYDGQGIELNDPPPLCHCPTTFSFSKTAYEDDYNVDCLSSNGVVCTEFDLANYSLTEDCSGSVAADVCEASRQELDELAVVYSSGLSRGYAQFSLANTDCDDDDAEILELVGQPERIDGKDSNCSNSIPIAEFDCDMDGFTIGGGFLFGDAYTRDELCTKEQEQPITCLRSEGSSEWITTERVCESLALGSGADSFTITQWVIRTDDPLNANLLISGTKRNGLPTGVDDCDDLCDTRNPGREEYCDGLDNDCSLTRAEDCSLEMALNGECAGTVCEDEADPDGDGAISCNANAEMVCAREVQTSLQCDGTTDIFRGDPSAYCTRATPYRESDDVDGSGLGVDDRCDGVMAAPRGLPYEGEEDADRDRHYACGPHHNLSGDEVGGPESVFVLVYFADDAGYPGGVNAVPLIYPRAAPGGGVLPSDVGLATRLLEDLDKLDWSPVSIGEPNPLTPIIQGQKVVVGSDAEGEAPSVNQAGEYAGIDPLLDLCIRAELCATQNVGKAPEWCAAGKSKAAISGRCAVVELKLNEASGLVYEPPLGADTGDYAGGGSPVDSASEDVFVAAPIAGELAGRLVWPQARIVESRRRVVEWDCFLTLGTYGCGALAEESLGSPGLTSAQLRRFTPSTLGAGRIFSAPLDAVMTDTRWWKELGRYYDGSDDPEVATVVTETLLSCWGDPTVNPDLTRSVHGRVGGDCRDEDSSDEAPTHRDALEGPYDVLGGLTGEQADCDTCIDGLDNNCDGLLDCEDPGCAPCFVGQGIASGCAGADPESPCASSGGCSAGRGARSPWPGLGELGMLLLAALAVPLWRRGVK